MNKNGNKNKSVFTAISNFLCGDNAFLAVTLFSIVIGLIIGHGNLKLTFVSVFLSFIFVSTSFGIFIAVRKKADYHSKDCKDAQPTNNDISKIDSNLIFTTCNLSENNYPSESIRTQMSQADFQAFINKCNRTDHIRPFEGIEKCILSSEDMKESVKTAFFKSGYLYNVSPRHTDKSLYDDRDVAYQATKIYSDGVFYDLTSKSSIAKIPIPAFSLEQETVFSMDYLLRMCASNLRERGQHDLSVVLLYKAVQIMPYSNIGWQEKDYMRLVFWLYEDGRLDEGDAVKDILQRTVFSTSKTDLTILGKERLAEYSTKTDLISFNLYGEQCCPNCAIFSGRVYSISSKSSAFPPLPQKYKDCGFFHIGCNVGIAPYSEKFDDSIYWLGKRTPTIASTYRELKDSRSEEAQKSYCETRKSLLKDEQKPINKEEYLKLKFLYPELAPKSLASYTRAKRAKSASYLKIEDKIKALNVNQPQSKIPTDEIYEDDYKMLENFIKEHSTI